MDFKIHLEKAWHLTLKHLASLIIMTLVMTALSFLTLSILAPVMLAGYFFSLLLLVREGREPKIQDLFSQMNLFLPLFLLSLLVIFVLMVGFKLFFLPGIAVLCFVTFGCIYILPLMIDKRLGILDAIKTSWQMAIQGNVADHIVVVILFMGLMSIGSSVFIGTLFTQPFATIFILSVYLERTAGDSYGATVITNSYPDDEK